MDGKNFGRKSKKHFCQRFVYGLFVSVKKSIGIIWSGVEGLQCVIKIVKNRKKYPLRKIFDLFWLIKKDYSRREGYGRVG